MDNHNQKLDDMDHRSLGNKLKLFMFSPATPGMPFWLPNGSQMRKRLDDAVYKAHKIRGYKPVLSPAMMEDDMWKVSGHYENYKENMFPSVVEKRDYLLKPMNCPGHVIMYQHDVVSYRDLPMRYFEFGQVHRNEDAGALHGLFRVREFTQDDAHIFCSEEQVEDEIVGVLDFIDSLLKTFDFEYEINLSTRPDKFIGEISVWDKSESAIKNALNKKGFAFGIDEKCGAFYGPKIDIKIKDNHSREWQLGTVQLDFNLPQRFELKYTGSDSEFHVPVMIHRAILGSFERFIGIVLENKGGLLPAWMSPNQVAIVPVNSDSDSQMDYCYRIKRELMEEMGADVAIYADSSTMNKRIKRAEQDKNPIVMIIGDKEVEHEIVNLRHKIKQMRFEQKFSQFKKELAEDMKINI